MALAFLLTSPASMPLEYSYGGEAESADGKADVLDAKGRRQFRGEDLPRQVDPSSADARVQGRRAAHGDSDAARRRAAGCRRAQTAEQAAAAAQPPPQVVDINMFVDDYKQVDGVLAAASRVAIDRRQADRGVDVQDHQGQPDVQARHVLGEVGGHGLVGARAERGATKDAASAKAGAGDSDANANRRVFADRRLLSCTRRRAAADRRHASRHRRRSERRRDRRRARHAARSGLVGPRIVPGTRNRGDRDRRPRRRDVHRARRRAATRFASSRRASSRPTCATCACAPARTGAT